jgi:hypothetical protein
MRIRKDLPDPTAKSGDAAAVNIVATGRKPVAGQPAQRQDAPGAAPKPTDPGGPRNRKHQGNLMKTWPEDERETQEGNGSGDAVLLRRETNFEGNKRKGE